VDALEAQASEQAECVRDFEADPLEHGLTVTTDDVMRAVEELHALVDGRLGQAKDTAELNAAASLMESGWLREANGVARRFSSRRPTQAASPPAAPAARRLPVKRSALCTGATPITWTRPSSHEPLVRPELLPRHGTQGFEVASVVGDSHVNVRAAVAAIGSDLGPCGTWSWC
jgi:hypothetical protein